MPLTDEQIEKMLEGQQKTLEALTKGQESLQKDLADAVRAGQAGTAEVVKEAILGLQESLGSRSDDDDEGDRGSANPPTEMTEQQLEAMPRKEFMAYMMNNFTGVLKNELKGVRDDLADTRTSSARERMARAIEAEREKHTDFDDWKDEMKVRLKKNPALTPSELYTLVRADNPQKAKELDGKYEEIRKQNAGEGGGEDGKDGFGGMRPGADQRSGGQQRTDMEKDEAFDDAWEKSFGDNPELLATGGE